MVLSAIYLNSMNAVAVSIAMITIIAIFSIKLLWFRLIKSITSKDIPPYELMEDLRHDFIGDVDFENVMIYSVERYVIYITIFEGVCLLIFPTSTFRRKVRPYKFRLRPCSCRLPQKKLTAIMGPSGCGKTTLLKMLLKEVRSTKGKVSASGDPTASRMRWQRMIGYVPQHEHLPSYLTVREALFLSARQRLFIGWSSSKVLSICHHVLLTMRLQHRADVRIAKLSGGEQKRLSIGLEIASNASLLIADEPTSGLDASLAASIMTLLADIRAHRMTVACVIHQPSDQIFKLFDNFVILAPGGYKIYQGAKPVEFFTILGYSLNQEYAQTIGEQIMDIVTYNRNDLIVRRKMYKNAAGRELEYDLEKHFGAEDSLAKVLLSFQPLNFIPVMLPHQHTQDAWSHKMSAEVHLPRTGSEDPLVQESCANHLGMTLTSLRSHSERYVLHFFRDAANILDVVFVVVVSGIVAFLYSNVEELWLCQRVNPFVGKNALLPVSYLATAGAGLVSSALSIRTFPIDIQYFERERRWGSSVYSYALSKFLFHTPMLAFLGMVYGAIFHIFLQIEFSSLWLSLISFMSIFWCCAGMGYFSSVVVSPRVSIALLAVLVSIQILFSGCFPSFDNLKSHANWSLLLVFGSFAHWGVESVYGPYLFGTVTHFSDVSPNSHKQQCLDSQEQEYGMTFENYVFDILVLFCMGIGWRILTFAVIYDNHAVSKYLYHVKNTISLWVFVRFAHEMLDFDGREEPVSFPKRMKLPQCIAFTTVGSVLITLDMDDCLSINDFERDLDSHCSVWFNSNEMFEISHAKLFAISKDSFVSLVHNASMVELTKWTIDKSLEKASQQFSKCFSAEDMQLDSFKVGQESLAVKNLSGQIQLYDLTSNEALLLIDTFAIPEAATRATDICLYGDYALLEVASGEWLKYDFAAAKLSELHIHGKNMTPWADGLVSLSLDNELLFLEEDAPPRPMLPAIHEIYEVLVVSSTRLLALTHCCVVYVIVLQKDGQMVMDHSFSIESPLVCPCVADQHLVGFDGQAFVRWKLELDGSG